MNKHEIDTTDVEYGIDSRYQSVQERESDATALMEARLMRMKNLSKDQVTKAKLLQLKLKMEEYMKNPVTDNPNYFTHFLTLYIDSIYSKRSAFAADVAMTPVSLSQVINKHREPNEEFILKLMVHSEKVYKNICEFQPKTWYQVYFQEKICTKMANRQEWQPEIEKHIRISVTL